MSFHEVRFPQTSSFGALGGPERRTEIVTLANGLEERNSSWAHARRRYDAGLAVQSLSDLEEVIAFFEARQGQLFGFRWKDWSDYKSCPADATLAPTAQPLGEGDGQNRVFQLQKLYVSGATSYARPLLKPVFGTLRIALNGTELDPVADYSVNDSTGVVELSDAPPIGSLLTAGFEFDVPVRFDTDRLDISLAGFQAGEVPSIPVVEIRI